MLPDWKGHFNTRPDNYTFDVVYHGHFICI